MDTYDLASSVTLRRDVTGELWLSRELLNNYFTSQSRTNI